MGMTPFPHGITSFGVPVIPNQEKPFAGKVFFVGSVAGVDWVAGVDAADNGTKQKPFASIDYAIGQCTANNDDVIYVLPGHTENIGAASAITCDIAGVSIIGLGSGKKRPLLTYTATAGTIVVSAANVSIKNILLTAGIDEVVLCLSVTGDDCTLDALDYYESSASYNCISFATITGDFCTIKNCHHTQTTAPAANSPWITLNAAQDFKMINNFMWINTTNNAGSGILHGATAASLRIFVAYNLCASPAGTTAVPVKLYAASTGMIAWNGFAGLQSGGISPGNCWCFENYTVQTVAKSGILDPATS